MSYSISSNSLEPHVVMMTSSNWNCWECNPPGFTGLVPGWLQRGNLCTVGQRKKVTAFFPAWPRPDQRGTNTGQIRKVPVDEIAWFLVYIMGETRSQLSANYGILACLLRDIWQSKLFAGKEVTAVPATCGEGGYWRRGRRLLYVLVLKLNSFVFFKTLEIKWLLTYHRLVICTSKHI